MYDALPVWLQHAAVSTQGWRLERERFGGDFDRILSEYERRDGRSARALREDRTRRLRDQLSWASKTPFWRSRFRTAGVDPLDDHPEDVLSNLDVLSKEEVRASARDLVPDPMEPGDLVRKHTSGTTGSGLVFWATRRSEQERWATWWRHRRRHGIARSTWCGYFGGRTIVPLEQSAPPYWRINWPGRTVMFSAFHLGPDTADRYLEEIGSRRLPWLHGYPSTLTLLASYAEEEGWTPPPELRIVTVSAESLDPRQRSTIESGLGVPVREHYGLAEGVANISECPEGSLHVDEDFAWIEFLPLDGTDDLYRLVGTNLTNPAFPLFRYDTGDYASISGAECGCGLPGRVVDRIDGRIEDVVVLPSGARVGRLDHIFKDLVDVREAQIYQPSVERVVLRVVPGAGYGEEEEARLRREARRRLGREIRLDIDHRERLPRTDRGKLRFVVSELDATPDTDPGENG